MDQDGAIAKAWGGPDCNDQNASIGPFADEQCNLVDDDCDGEVDDDDADTPPVDQAWSWLDADRDGFGDPTTGAPRCPATDVVYLDADCDDAEATIWPGAPERCDAVDSDCDGLRDVEEGALMQPEVCGGGDDDCDGLTDDADPDVRLLGLPEYFPDADGDFYGATGATPIVCNPTPDHVVNDLDCNDGNALQNPDTLWPADLDGDGWGNEASGTTAACFPPDGFTFLDGDCNDADDTVYPLAPEDCGPVDRDCDGLDGNLDLDDAVGKILYWRDLDGDGLGDEDYSGLLCEDPLVPFTFVGGDCDDENPLVPGPVETCEQGDEDCNGDLGLEDRGLDPSQLLDGWIDADGDGLGDPGQPILWCEEIPAQVVTNDDDCDDGDDAIGLPAAWRDEDGDGWGGEALDVVDCALPEGTAPVGGDCDDADPARHPGRVDPLSTPVDEDCDASALRLYDSPEIWYSPVEAARLRPSIAPDLDGDGRLEVVLSTNAGIFLIDFLTYLPPSGLDDLPPPWFTATVAPLVAFPDIDADGFPDIALGAYKTDVTLEDEGAVHLHAQHGFPTAHMEWPIDVSDAALFGTRANEELGYTLWAGDLDGDGIDDLAAGAYGKHYGGHVGVLLGPLEGRFVAVTESDIHVRNDTEYDHAGNTLGSVGDMDGDGLDEFLVAIPYDGADNAGRIAVSSGAPPAGVFDDFPGSWVGASGEAMGSEERFLEVGDLTGDGLADALLYEGSTAGAALYAAFPYEATVEDAVATFNPLNSCSSIAGATDLDLDGVPDPLLYCYGAVAGFLGRSEGTWTEADRVLQVEGKDVAENRCGEFVGDIDNDGTEDILLGGNPYELWVYYGPW